MMSGVVKSACTHRPDPPAASARPTPGDHHSIVFESSSNALRASWRAAAVGRVACVALSIALIVSCAGHARGQDLTVEVVVTSDLGVPIPGAVVSVLDVRRRVAARGLSAEDGRVSLRLEYDGWQVLLSATARGFLPSELGLWPAGSVHAVTLTRAASIVGTIHSVAGAPPPALSVRMLVVSPPLEMSWPSLGLATAPVASVSRSGAFDFPVAPAGVSLRLVSGTPGWDLDAPVGTLRVGEERAVGAVDVTAVRSVVIRCVDAEDRSIPGARVAVVGAPVSPRRGPWDSSGNPVSLSERCDQLPPARTDSEGRAVLSVSGPRGSVVVDSDLHEIWRGDYDAVAAPIVTVRLQRAAGVLRGRVTSDGGSWGGSSTTLLRVLDVDGGLAGEAYPGKSGEFLVPALRGRGPWTVRPVGLRWVGFEPTVVRALDAEVAVHLPPRVRVDLQVTASDGHPPASISVIVTRLAAGGVKEAEVLVAELFADAHGGYRIFLPTGVFQIEVGARGHRRSIIPHVELSGDRSTEQLPTVHLAPE